MAIATAPTINNTQSFNQWAGRGSVTSDAGSYAHTGHRLQHVGTVNVAPNSNTVAPQGGFFDCWYCLQDHIMLIDIVSQQVGGPV